MDVPKKSNEVWVRVGQTNIKIIQLLNLYIVWYSLKLREHAYCKTQYSPIRGYSAENVCDLQYIKLQRISLAACRKQREIVFSSEPITYQRIVR